MPLKYCAWCGEHYEREHICKRSLVDASLYVPSWIVVTENTRESMRKTLAKIQKEIGHGTNTA
jgi:hypothetical protein